jgi:cyclic pyranopterin phosphate synthase
VAQKLTHLDSRGQARMVDVGGKRPTLRKARAEGRLVLSEEAWRLAREGNLPKGDLLATARVAGILAAKKTPGLIPLCHPVALSHVAVDFRWEEDGRTLAVETEAHARDVTGVEMEALTACALACLTLYDMVKGVDKGAVIGPIQLVSKSGGKSGRYRRR